MFCLSFLQRTRQPRLRDAYGSRGGWEVLVLDGVLKAAACVEYIRITNISMTVLHSRDALE
jgi:hypothetical protein